MTITVTNIVAGPFTATGDEQVVSFDFKVFTSEEVEVVVGADRTPIDPDGYIVTPNRAVDGQVMEGGTITLLDGSLTAGQVFNAVAKPAKTQDLVFSDTGSRLRNLNEVADRAALRAIRAQYDGALEGAGAELIEAATEAGAAAGSAAAFDRALRNGGNLSAYEAIAFRQRLKQFFVTPEDYGAVPNDIAFDNATAINAAEAAAALAGVAVRFREGADYYFKSTIGGARDRLVWQGNRTRLIYNGAATNIDLLLFGNGTREYREQSVSGLELCSLTNMTAGCGVRTPLAVRSSFHFDNINGQDWVEAHGNTLFDGFWAEKVDNIRVSGDALNAKNRGFMVNGTLGAGPKADCWLMVGKISSANIGVVMGGGFGGLYITPNTTMIGNKVNMVADQSLTAEANRELFATGAIFDVAYGSNLASDANVIINDNGGLRINLTGCWFSAGGSHGIWVKALQGILTISGCRIVQMVGDGFRTSVAGSGFTLITGCQITNCGGWGINGLVDGHAVAYGANEIGANTLGNVNTAFTNASRTTNGGALFLGDVRAGFGNSGGFVRDNLNYWVLSGGNPLFNVDTGDYYNYDRPNNIHGWYIGNQAALRIKPGYIAAIASGYYAPAARLTGTANGFGVAQVSHGDANLPRKIKNVQAFYVETDGSAWALPGSANVTASYISFPAHAPAAGKPFVITYEYYETPW